MTQTSNFVSCRWVQSVFPLLCSRKPNCTLCWFHRSHCHAWRGIKSEFLSPSWIWLRNLAQVVVSMRTFMNTPFRVQKKGLAATSFQAHDDSFIAVEKCFEKIHINNWIQLDTVLQKGEPKLISSSMLFFSTWSKQFQVCDRSVLPYVGPVTSEEEMESVAHRLAQAEPWSLFMRWCLLLLLLLWVRVIPRWCFLMMHHHVD